MLLRLYLLSISFIKHLISSVLAPQRDPTMIRNGRNGVFWKETRNRGAGNRYLNNAPQRFSIQSSNAPIP